MTRLLFYLDRVIDLGLVTLLVFTPLAMGSVRDSQQAIAQFLALLVFAAWVLKVTWAPAPLAIHLDDKGNPDSPEGSALRRRRRREFLGGRIVLTGFEIPALLFAGLIIFQLVSLPFEWVQAISPRTAAIVRNSRPVLGEGQATVRGLEAWLASHPEIHSQLPRPTETDPKRPASLIPEGALPARSSDALPLSLAPHATLRQLWTYLAYLMVFVVGVHHWRDRRRADRIIGTLAVMSAVMAAYGMAQILAGERQIPWLRPSAEGRAPTGPFVNPNHFAGFMEMVLPVTLGLVMAAWTRARAERDPTARLLEKGGRVLPSLLLLSFSGLAGTLVFFASRSRGGLLATLAASTLFLVLFPWRRSGSLKPLVGIGLLVACGVGVATRAGGDGLWSRYSTLADPEGEPSFAFRLDTSMRTLGMARDFPVVGVGIGAFPEVYPSYAAGGRLKRAGFAHNDFAQLAAEAGAAGVILAFASLLLLVGSCLVPGLIRTGSPRRHVVHGLAVGVTAILVHSLFDFNLQIFSNGLLFVVMVALLVADRASRLAHRPGRLPAG